MNIKLFFNVTSDNFQPFHCETLLKKKCATAHIFGPIQHFSYTNRDIIPPPFIRSMLAIITRSPELIQCILPISSQKHVNPHLHGLEYQKTIVQ